MIEVRPASYVAFMLPVSVVGIMRSMRMGIPGGCVNDVV